MKMIRAQSCRSRQGKLISEVGPPGKGNVGLSLSDLLRNDTGSVFVVREVSTELAAKGNVPSQY